MIFCGIDEVLSKENWEVSPVVYYDTNTKEFSKPVKFLFQNQILTKIQSLETPANTKPWYALPGFCDAYVTLGVNPWGGEANIESLKTSLQGFLSAGFTHIESVGDGQWVERVQNLIQNGSWKGPVVSRPTHTILPNPGIPIPKSTFTIVESDQELDLILSKAGNSRIHFYQRRLGNYLPDIKYLFQLKKKYHENGTWIFHTFADPLATQEGLGSGWNILFHPLDGEIPRFQLEKIQWAPLMSLYYYQQKRSANLWREEREWALNNHFYFSLYYKEVSQDLKDTLGSEEIALAEIQFLNYYNQFLSREYMKKNLLFATGTGHPLSYPGLSAIKELEIWDRIFSYWEKKNKERMDNLELNKKKSKFPWFWWIPKIDYELLTPSQDPEKIPNYRKDILEILTTKTCQFLGAGHSGSIQTGREAHILFYDTNPLEKSLGIMNPIAVYSNGRLQYGKKIHKVIKRN